MRAQGKLHADVMSFPWLAKLPLLRSYAALHSLSQQQRLFPLAGEILFYLAYSYASEGQTECAVAVALEGLRHDPACPKALRKLGEYLWVLEGSSTEYEDIVPVGALAIDDHGTDGGSKFEFQKGINRVADALAERQATSTSQWTFVAPVALLATWQEHVQQSKKQQLKRSIGPWQLEQMELSSEPRWYSHADAESCRSAAALVIAMSQAVHSQDRDANEEFTEQQAHQTHAHINSATTKAAVRGGLQLLCRPWCRQGLGACSKFCGLHP
jgi:hypothetical protein